MLGPVSRLKKTDAHGIDSFAEVYRSEGIQLSFDFGPYSGTFEGWPKETKYEELKIDGKDARIGTVERTAATPPAWYTDVPFCTKVYFRLDERVALEMTAECKSKEEVALARKIFESITFKAKGG